MEAHNEVDVLCTKVKAISQGPNAELLKKFIDLLYERELGEQEPEYFSPEDLAAIEEGMQASLSGDRTQFTPLGRIQGQAGLMSYRIAIYRETEKMLDGLDRTTARRIEAKIEELAQDPFSPACPDR